MPSTKRSIETNTQINFLDESTLINKIIYTEDVLVKEINMLNGIAGYKSLNHEVIHGNNNFIKYNGYKNIDNMMGLTDYDLVYQKYADIYHKQENDALLFNCYTAIQPAINKEGNAQVFINNKYPWINNKECVIGIICHTNVIQNSDIAKVFDKLSTLMCSIVGESNHNNVHYLNKDIMNGLSKREAECFFYLIRGKSAKCISKILGISHRTVETHIDHLKLKLRCKNKYELIESAIKYGLVNIIPSSLFSLKLGVSLDII